jgi:hypothetical protein
MDESARYEINLKLITVSNRFYRLFGDELLYL